MTLHLFNEDSLEALKRLPENSVDSCVTDPPSGISFLGKDWDNFSKSTNIALGKQSPANIGNKIFPKRGRPIRGWCEEDRKAKYNFIEFITEIFTEVYRVLKPGAFGLVWCLPRTSHWTAFGLDEAGFEVRDVIHHFFASGMPKSLNVSKSLKKKKKDQEAEKYVGYGTGIKPAAEHWIVIRKPLAIPSVADNMLKYGTGALNIDACRQPLENDDRLLKGGSYSGNRTGSNERSTFNSGNQKIEYTTPPGRWPANLIFSHTEGCQDTECIDGCPVKILNEQAGVRKSGKDKTATRKSVSKYFKGEEFYTSGSNYGDSGPASRFFFCAKPGRKERNTGCEKLFWKIDVSRSSGFLLVEEEDWKKLPINSRDQGNFHPTCKGLKLMSYLCKLITPSGGIVLDPFMGSGTTGVAAIKEGFGFIGVEKDPDYYKIAEARVNHK